MQPQAYLLRDHRLTILLVGTLVLSSLLAGCVTNGNQVDEEPELPGPLLFGDGSGVGAVEPLLELSLDPLEDGGNILAACQYDEDGLVPCSTRHLEAILGAQGSGYAFEVLDALSATDPTIQRYDHPMAHDLGAYALYVYGTIGETLSTCSHLVFQGCLHGALQEYFRHVDVLDAATINSVCPVDVSAFERYACVHGLGHGLVLATNYHLGDALDLCATLDARGSGYCYGGAFMENVVAYMDHQMGHGHADHGHGGHGGHQHGPMFWVNEADPSYPCNVVDTPYRSHCWLMQTSLILYLNHGDFQEVAQICAELSSDLHQSCFTSMGRDASSYAQRDPDGVSYRCAFTPSNESHTWCIQGFISAVVNHYADPSSGLASCQGIRSEDKTACYRAIGEAGIPMAGPEKLTAICAQAEEGYEAACRKGARLD